MHGMDSSEWQQDRQADLHALWCLYGLYRWEFLMEPFFQWISLLVIWDSLSSAQAYSNCGEFLGQKDLWSASHYSGAVDFLALCTCSPWATYLSLGQFILHSPGCHRENKYLRVKFIFHLKTEILTTQKLFKLNLRISPVLDLTDKWEVNWYIMHMALRL